MNIIEPRLDGTNLRIGTVQAHFTNEIGSEMVKVYCRTLKKLNVTKDNITLATVPGVFEVPIVLMNLASFEQSDALIAIGVVIHDKTYHFELVSNKSGAGVNRVALDYNILIANAILATENDERTVACIEEKTSDAAEIATECANLASHLLSEQYEDDEE